jgi:hypothetical protein
MHCCINSSLKCWILSSYRHGEINEIRGSGSKLLREALIPRDWKMQELNRQDQLVEEADTKTEQATTEMKTANSRLKETVTAVVQAFDMISSIASH